MRAVQPANPDLHCLLLEIQPGGTTVVSATSRLQAMLKFDTFCTLRAELIRVYSYSSVSGAAATLTDMVTVGVRFDAEGNRVGSCAATRQKMHARTTPMTPDL